MAGNAFMNVAGVITPIAIMLSEKSNDAKGDSAASNIEIGVGLGTNDAGGQVPAVSVFNVDGGRLGQHVPNKGDNVKPGESVTLPISHDQGSNGQPEYVYITSYSDDAVCIDYVGASGSGVQWTWTGDVGFTCGADWYPSTAKQGTDNFQPKCVWIDANHSNDLKFIAMSMHMPDFNGSPGLAQEYSEDVNTMCNSKARFMMWGEVPTNPGQNFIPPFFSPPLQYKGEGDGADVDKGALYGPGTVQKRDIGDSPSTVPRAKKNGNVMPDHVIISDHKAHNATQVCESETSRGPSFVSTHEGVYCDMATKTAHPLCSVSKEQAADTEAVSKDKKVDCFDVETRSLVSGGPKKVHARDMKTGIKKQYKTFARWAPNSSS